MDEFCEFWTPKHLLDRISLGARTTDASIDGCPGIHKGIRTEIRKRRFLEALSKAKRFELAHEGQILVVYANGAEPVLRFSRIVEK